MVLAAAIETAAPLYNLVLGIIALFLFVKLFSTAPRKMFLQPWQLIFAALIIFFVEEIFTVLRLTGVINIPVHINGFFELAIVAIVLYALLVQKQHS